MIYYICNKEKVYKRAIQKTLKKVKKVLTSVTLIWYNISVIKIKDKKLYYSVIWKPNKKGSVKMKITPNAKRLVDLLSQESGFISSKELKAKYNLQDSIQALNGTLSAKVYDGVLINKDKKPIDGKFVTVYKLVDNYQDLLQEQGK